MSIYATNAAGFLADRLAYDVRNEVVGGLLVPYLTGVVTVPPRSLHQWHLIDLCTPGPDASKPWLARDPFLDVRALGQLPRTDVHSRVIGAWCTQYANTALVQAIQADRLVQFDADYPYDIDWNTSKSTNGMYQVRGARGAWPAGYADAVWLRLEAERAAGQGDVQSLGIAQINIATGNHIVEGSTNQEGEMCFRHQIKGLTRVDQREACGDVRVVIPRGSREGTLAVLVSSWAKGIYLASGFELRAAMPEYAPTSAPPVPPADPVRAAVMAVLPALRAFDAAMEGEGL